MNDHVDDLSLSRLIDGDLPTLSHEAVLDHLLHCPACAARHEELVEVAATIRRLPAVEWNEQRTAAVALAIGHTRRPVARVGLVSVATVLLPAAGLVGLAVVLGGFSVPAAAFGLTLKIANAFVSLRLFAAVSELLLVMLLVALAAPFAAYPLARWR
jgi:anti-sigma factor RsiW